MSKDLLERELSAAMTRRAAVAAPRPPSFDDVEGRAARHRQRRANHARLIGVASIVVLIVGVLAVAGLRDRGGEQVIVGPAEDADTVPSTVPAWAVLPDLAPSIADESEETQGGPGAELDDLDVRPYLVVAPHDGDHDVIYALDGDQWTINRAHFVPDGYGAFADTEVLTGSGFDPSRLTVVPNAMNLYRPTPTDEDVRTGPPNPFLEATPEELLAAPDSHALVQPVERLGGRDWVLLPTICSDKADSCRSAAIGGDADRVLLVTVSAPAAFDLRQHLVTLELRPADEMERRPGEPDPSLDPSLDDDPSGGSSELRYGYGSFVIVTVPGQWPVATVPRDDSAWPAEVPTDYCTAYEAWRQVQLTNLGSFGTPGWIRWVQALATMAPTAEVGEAYTVLAAEQGAGHDTSASEPGMSALTTVVNESDAGCPT